MYVLHVVSQNSQLNGYSRRTQEIVRAQRTAGIRAEVLTATDGTYNQIEYGAVADAICNGVQLAPELWHPECLQQAVLAAILLNGLKRKLLREQPDVIHAHVPWPCAVAAQAASALFDVPWVYEVRGLQEESAVAEGTRAPHSVWYYVWRSMETWSRRRARAVCAIAPTLAADAEERGAKDVVVTPNAVDPERFRPLDVEARAATRRLLNLGDETIVAYFGSIRPLEGVGTLVEAAGRMPDKMRCLIVGAGSSLPKLQAKAGPKVEFCTPVPPDQVGTFMSAVDIVAITRGDSKVTRLVTPLKPLEVLACGTPVVSADLPALRYVGERGTWFYPAGDVDALVSRLTELAPGARELGVQGHEWVVRDRTWARTVEAQRMLYERALCA